MSRLSNPSRTVLLGLFALTFAGTLRLLTGGGQRVRVPAAPEVRGKNQLVELTLRAETTADGHGAFSFNGQTLPPVIRVSPGDVLKMTYINAMSSPSPLSCATGPCMNMTNLHFHGLGVSPNAPQDDVLDMIAMPGQTLNYAVAIPSGQPPGLYWYHTHPHGESQRQALDGMSGAIVVEGIDEYVPEVRTLRERVLVIRGRDIEHDPDAESLRRQVGISDAACGTAREAAERIMTVNGAVRPEIALAPGERQFWRIVNAAADTYADIQIDGQPLEIVALDGIPRGYYDAPTRNPRADHRLLPPGGRLEVIVTGPPTGTPAALRTRCVDTGPAGDPNPEMVLADLVPGARSDRTVGRPFEGRQRGPDRPALAMSQVHRHPSLDNLQTTEPHFIVTFTEDKGGFYINGQKFVMAAQPMVRVNVGSYQHWRIVNDTDEIHPMHIHQAHFLAYAENGGPLPDPVWVDTFNVPYRGSIDVIVDVTDPVIRGMAVFHCHLLNHEDKGMMAKVLFK